MKKTIQNLLFASFLLLSSFVFGQNSVNPNFISKIVPPIPVLISETANLRVSIIGGTLENSDAISLVFENKTDHSLTFNWTLKDKTGNAIGETHSLTLAPNSTLDYSTKSEFSNSLVLLVAKNAKASDFVIEIGN